MGSARLNRLVFSDVFLYSVTNKEIIELTVVIPKDTKNKIFCYLLVIWVNTDKLSNKILKTVKRNKTLNKFIIKECKKIQNIIKGVKEFFKIT